MKKTLDVAVLGAGITGASTALFLSRRGVRVALFDLAEAPCCRASRWNEGKIHLGFLYAGDASLRTVERILPGGLAFRDLVEDLLGCSLKEATTPEDDLYLVHRESVVQPLAMAHRFHRIADTIRRTPGAKRYLTSVSDCAIRSLTRNELEGIADTGTIVAGFRVPERSVSTHWLADRYVEAVDAAPGIECLFKTRVTGVRPCRPGAFDGPWLVDSDAGTSGPYDYVVNALWEGRPAVDAAVGLHPETAWSHRFRLCLFVRTDRPLDHPSLVIGTGPFGDIKNYNGKDFYLSWYPAGLVAEGSALSPPPLPDLDKDFRSQVECSTWTHLGALIPSAGSIAAAARQVDVNGGWVFAMGSGSLADPKSSLHRRDRVGIRQNGTYISVDTGKYSIAPWLALNIADRIHGE